MSDDLSRFSTLFRLYEASPDPAFIAEAATSRTIWINRAFADVTGYTAAEIVGSDLSRLRPADEAAKATWIEGARAAREARPGRFDIHCQRADGSPLIIDITFLPIPDETASPRYVLGVSRDVTRSRQLTREVQERERRFHDFAETASDWFWEIGPDLRLTWMSISDRAMRESFQGRTFREIAPIVEEAEIQGLEADLQARRGFRNFTFARKGPDGRFHYLSSSGKPIYDETGAFQGYRGCAQEVTATIETERRLLSAIEAMRDSLILFDQDDRVVLHNSKYLEMYPHLKECGSIIGMRYEDLLRLTAGRDIKDVEAVADPEAWIGRRMALHRNPPADPYERELTDGRWILMHERRTADGGIVGIRSDITQLKRAELDLRAALALAEAHNRAKSDFLANMSHELRTPLNAIIGFSETMSHELLGPIGSKRYREYADDIRKSGGYLLDLINDILDLSRIEAGKRELEPEAFSFAELAGEALRMMRETAAKARITFTEKISPTLGVVTLDRRAIRQILLNLLSNAVKFSPEGSTVTIAAEGTNTGFAFTVTDAGSGIPADRLKSLAKPFVQIENVMSRRQPGSGLGLAISRSLAELHGGTLTIESELGRGTRVIVRLPVAIAAAAA